MARYFVLVLMLAFVGGDAARAQRAVTVVYDDSGSMRTQDRWAYASYALQTLAGLLHPDDALTVVPMNRSGGPEPLPLTDPAAAIARVAAWPIPVNNAPTPYQTLLTGMDALAAQPADDKWLVVLSDGEFDDLAEDPAALERLTTAVQTFVAQTGARTLFLLIGEDRARVDALAAQPAVAFWQEQGQATVYTALGSDDIVRQMEQIAADITARTLERGGPTVTADGSALRVTSDFPLRRLTALEQRTGPNPDLLSIETAEADGADLRALPGLDVRTPDQSAAALSGRITHVRHARDDAVLPAGELTLTADRPPDLRTLALLPEVAARLVVVLTDPRGRPLPTRNRVYEACRGDSALVRAALVAPDGDTLTHRMRRPDLLEVRLFYGQAERAMTRDAASGFVQHAVVVDSLPRPVSVAAAYPGYFNFKSQIYTLDGVYCAPPRALGLQPPDPWSAPVTHLDTADPLALRPTADGEPVDPAEFADWTLDVVGEPRLDVEIGRGDGHWTIRPKQRWGLAPLTPAGPVEVEVEVASGRAQEAPARAVVTLEVAAVPFWVLWGTFLLTLLALLLLLWYLIGILRKPRFVRGSGIEYRRTTGRRDTRPARWNPLPTPWYNRWLVPYRAERRLVEGVRFIATRNAGTALIHHDALTPDATIGGLPVAHPGLDDPEALDDDRPINSNETFVRPKGRRQDEYRFVIP